MSVRRAARAPAAHLAFGAGLRRGALSPSPLALGIALLTALLTGLAAITFIDERALKGDWMATFDGDDFAFLAGAAERGTADAKDTKDAKDEGPELLIIGSSALREAILSPQQLGQITGIGRVQTLTAGGLTHLEALQLVDHLAPNPGRLVLLELSERGLSMDTAESQGLIDAPRLPLDGPTFDAAVAAAGLRPRAPRFEALALRHARFFLARPQAIRNLLNGPPQALFHQADHLKTASAADWDRWERRLVGWFRALPTEADRNTLLYVKLIEGLRARGGRLALVEAPRNPALLERALRAEGAEAGFREGQRRAQALADAVRAPRWRPAKGIPAQDYVDYAHIITASGRTRFTEALASQIRGLR